MWLHALSRPWLHKPTRARLSSTCRARSAAPKNTANTARSQQPLPPLQAAIFSNFSANSSDIYFAPILVGVGMPCGALHLCEESELLQCLQLDLPFPLLSLLQEAELMLEVAVGGLLRR